MFAVALYDDLKRSGLFLQLVSSLGGLWRLCLGLGFRAYSLGHVQVGSYRYRSLIEGLYTL